MRHLILTLPLLLACTAQAQPADPELAHANKVIDAYVESRLLLAEEQHRQFLIDWARELDNKTHVDTIEPMAPVQPVYDDDYGVQPTPEVLHALKCEFDPEPPADCPPPRPVDFID